MVSLGHARCHRKIIVTDTQSHNLGIIIENIDTNKFSLLKIKSSKSNYTSKLQYSDRDQIISCCADKTVCIAKISTYSFRWDILMKFIYTVSVFLAATWIHSQLPTPHTVRLLPRSGDWHNFTDNSSGDYPLVGGFCLTKSLKRTQIHYLNRCDVKIAVESSCRIEDEPVYCIF